MKLKPCPRSAYVPQHFKHYLIPDSLSHEHLKSRFANFHVYFIYIIVFVFVDHSVLASLVRPICCYGGSFSSVFPCLSIFLPSPGFVDYTMPLSFLYASSKWFGILWTALAFHIFFLHLSLWVHLSLCPCFALIYLQESKLACLRMSCFWSCSFFTCLLSRYFHSTFSFRFLKIITSFLALRHVRMEFNHLCTIYFLLWVKIAHGSWIVAEGSLLLFGRVRSPVIRMNMITEAQCEAWTTFFVVLRAFPDLSESSKRTHDGIHVCQQDCAKLIYRNCLGRKERRF